MRTLALVTILLGFIAQLLLASLAIDYELIGSGLHPALAIGLALIVLLLQMAAVRNYRELTEYDQFAARCRAYSAMARAHYHP